MASSLATLLGNLIQFQSGARGIRCDDNEILEMGCHDAPLGVRRVCVIPPLLEKFRADPADYSRARVSGILHVTGVKQPAGVSEAVQHLA